MCWGSDQPGERTLAALDLTGTGSCLWFEAIKQDFMVISFAFEGTKV